MYQIIMFVYQNLNMRLFSHVSVIFTVIINEWLATNSRNAILNNFEEYYTSNEIIIICKNIIRYRNKSYNTLIINVNN